MQRNDRSYKDLKQKQKSAIADKTYKLYLKFYLENQRMPDAAEMKDICKVLFIFTHLLADHAIIVGVAHRLQFLLYSSNGLWLSVRELYKHERTDIFTDFFISASDSFPFCICKVEQIIVIIGNFCVVSHAFIDIKSLGNKACADNIYFIDFKELVSLIFNSSSTDTNNVLGRKCVDDGLRLGGVVGMLLINNDDKFHTGTMCVCNTVKEILTLAVANGCVTTFGYKLPVDECCAAGANPFSSASNRFCVVLPGANFIIFLRLCSSRLPLPGQSQIKAVLALTLVR